MTGLDKQFTRCRYRHVILQRSLWSVLAIDTDAAAADFVSLPRSPRFHPVLTDKSVAVAADIISEIRSLSVLADNTDAAAADFVTRTTVDFDETDALRLCKTGRLGHNSTSILLGFSRRYGRCCCRIRYSSQLHVLARFCDLLDFSRQFRRCCHRCRIKLPITLDAQP